MNGGRAERELFELIAAGDVEGVRRLLEREPAAAGARDGDGVSALMHALYRGHGAVVALLRAASPRRDVFEAAALGEVDGLAGGDPNVYSSDGFTPLHLAVFGGHARAVRALLAGGADPNALSLHATIRVRPLHTACALEVAVENPDVVRALLEAGADANGRTADGGATPLHNAAGSGSVELVRLLLEYGADPEARLDDGRTPADLAADDAVRSLLGAAPRIPVDE